MSVLSGVVTYQVHYILAYNDCLIAGEWLSSYMLHSYLAILGTQKSVNDNLNEIFWRQIINYTYNNSV